jgi:hypothetical protein
MIVDPSWDVMPVANPDLAARKRARLFDRACLNDPMGLEEPAYQLRDREKVVMPSTLDRRSRVLLLRAQEAIAISLDEEARAAEPDGVVPETVLRWHEWEIATALRDITDLRAEHELNTVASVGPMTQSVSQVAGGCSGAGRGGDRGQGQRTRTVRGARARGGNRVPELAGCAPGLRPERPVP